MSEFRGRGEERGWRGERSYRDDRERSIEYRGAGQSGYGAGRAAEDRAYQRHVRNEPALAAGSFEDRNHELGVDDRFTGRGARDSHWPDRGGRDSDRRARRAGRDLGAERREPIRQQPRDDGYSFDERHGAGYGEDEWSGGYTRDERPRHGTGYGQDEWSGGYTRDDRPRHGAGYGQDEWSGGYTRDERPRHGAGYGHDEGAGGYPRDERARHRGGPGGESWSGGGQGRDERTGYGGDGRDERSSHGGFGRGDIEPHVHRGIGPHRGKGPVGYQRSDERIRELVCESLADDDEVDASQIEVSVSGGEVTLSGTVEDRRARREAEECAFSVSGVRDVQNQLKVRGSRSWTRTSAPGNAAAGQMENANLDVRSESGTAGREPSAQDKKHRA